MRVERDQALARLAALEEELRTLFAATKDQIFVLNQEGRFMESAVLGSSASGHPNSNPSGKSLEQVFPPEQVDTIRNYIALAIDTHETVQIEYRMGSGEQSRWFRGYVTPMTGERVLWEARDVTEHRKSEEALRHHTERLEAATLQQERWRKALEQNAAELERRVAERTAELERTNRELVHEIAERKQAAGMLRKRETVLAQAGQMAHLGAWDIEIVNPDDVNANTPIWSDEIYRVFGYEPGSVAVSNDLFFRHVHPDDRQRVADAVANAIATRQPYSIEHRIVRADGTERIVHEHGEITYEQDRPVRIVGAVQDITERKHAEQEREELHRDLERRAAELEATNKELEAFTYSLSHDLRAPINLIDQFARMALEDYGPALPEEGRRLLQLVHENAETMNCLAEDLLTLTRITRQPLRWKNVSMQDLVAQTLNDIEPLKAGRDVQIGVGELAPCMGDPVLLKQVWLSLIANALKFTRKSTSPRIEIGSVRCDGCEHSQGWTYFVRDNGAGFDMANADRLFQAFQRLHHAEEYEGHGLGLAIVERVIRRHAGRAWAEAAVDKGATFSFTLG